MTLFFGKTCVYIEGDFPDEYTGSKYTHMLREANAKAKANVVQGLPELIEIAINEGGFHENIAPKHSKDVGNGWYRYHVRFGLPIYHNEKIERYNIFSAFILLRHALDGKNIYTILLT